MQRVVIAVGVGLLCASTASAQDLERRIEAVEVERRAVDRAIEKIREVQVESQRFLRSNDASHGFSVILAVGDLQGGTPARNLPEAASKALADLSQFLPYKSYELLDAQWILGSPRSTGRLRGPENREYELVLRTTPRAENGVHIDFNLHEPGLPFGSLMGRKVTGGGTQVVLARQPGRLIDTSFTMDVGETVVVGTSRLQGDKALIVLLTAVGK
jgi:hypothetical protein